MYSLLGKNSRRPDITFRANGCIDITSRVAHLIGINDGDVLDVAVDGGEYYLYVRTKASQCIGRHEAQCWPTKKGSRNYRAHSKRLCNAILRIVKANTVARLPIGARSLLFNKTTPAVVLIVRNNLTTQQS